MREGWEIKRLGEVCDLYQPKTISSDMLVPNGKYLVYGANGIIGRYNEYNHEKPEVLMTCRGATCGTINVSQPYSWINGNAMVIHPKENNIIQPFLKYLLQGIDLSIVITGAAQPQITRQSLKPVKVVLPPVQEQEKIVAELDCLTGIIEKKKQQLKELDNLAQSVFYDMFGTTLEEKGFPVKLMGKIGTFQRGAGLQKKDFVEDGMPCIHYGQIHTAFGSYTTKHLTTIPKSLYDISKIAHPGDLLMVLTSEDVEGSCKSTAWLGEYDIAVGSDAAIFSNHSQNAIYLSYCTRTRSFFNEKKKYANGFKVTHIKTGDIGTIPIAVPPRALQDLFAQKIEAIEKQKELIKKSIQETETLYNSRMDYWFN